MNRCLHAHRRGPAALAALVLGMLSVAAGAADDLASLVVPPGEFANMQTHRLYYHCTGEGHPTVIIDHGIGGAAVEWVPVQEQLAAVTRVCTYDRAGYGWSDTGPGPRTSAQAVAELEALLAAAAIEPPYLLVGHSFGGFNVRQYAARNPDATAGVVLIEASSERTPLHRTRPQGAGRHALDEAAIMARQADAGPYEAAAGFLNSRRKAVFAQMDELQHFALSADQAAASELPQSLPLLVIARDDSASTDGERERLWRRAQLALSRLTDAGRFVVAEHSSHNVHLDRPGFVADAIADMIAALR